jgi:nucleotide-binding universal stress UspA family protein
MNERESRGRGCVIVGLDSHGEPNSGLMAAADEAERRAADLAVITVLRPNHDAGLNIQGLRRDELLLEQAVALQNLHAVTASLHSRHPRVGVATYCLTENDVDPRREPLLGAELLVLGTQDRYGRQALVLGSVSRLLLTSSHCPVLVVPDGPTARSRRLAQPPLIVVGVSEHPADTAVVRAAYAESIGRGGEVLLVHAYSPRVGETSGQARERAQAVLAEFVGQAPAETQVSVAVVDDEPVPTLLRLAKDATLLVFGGRTGALSGLVRGSVSRALMETVPCPVLAVPRNLTSADGPPATITPFLSGL